MKDTADVASIEQLVLENEALSLRIAPISGGRITSLVHRPTGSELLWRQPPLPDWPRYGVPEEAADVQGWDECCPAIGPGFFPPGPWESVQNPAQGEVYALPWQVQHADRRRVTLSVHGIRFPYMLEREIVLEDSPAKGLGVVRLRYRMANHAALPFPFIWSAHPLLDASMGARIVLPSEVQEVIIDSTASGRLGAAYEKVRWPHALQTDGRAGDLAHVAPGTGWADKLYIPHVAGGACALLRSDGLAIHFHWDVQSIPHLGVWIDTRGDGEARVALEPCLGYPDLLAGAAVWGQYQVLAAGAERRWELLVSVMR